MAKFTSKDLRLKDGQKVTWGTDLDANMSYDGTANQLGVDVTVSGVDPTQDYHLTTKWYVDNEIATLSGSVPTSHSSLTNLDADDHTQYVLVDGSRGFTSTVSGVTPTEDYHLSTKGYVDGEITTLSGLIITDHGGLSGLGDDDHTQYILVDGSRGFTSTVSGVTPTEDYHLTTKGYVDTEITTLSGSIITDHGSLSGLGDDDHTQYILVDGSRGFTSTVSGVTPTESYHLTTKDYVDGEISTLSGSIITDHGSLSGLGDDDHTQYILVDGSRGFTNTVSGVYPTASYHLATKEYVDSGSTDRHGRESMSLNDSTVTVSGFADLGHTNYTVNAVLENITDADPSIYPFIVSGRASDYFVVTFAGDMDSNNYILNWTIIED